MYIVPMASSQSLFISIRTGVTACVVPIDKGSSKVMLHTHAASWVRDLQYIPFSSCFHLPWSCVPAVGHNDLSPYRPFICSISRFFSSVQSRLCNFYFDGDS
jgi:hypothetical protein